MNYEAIYRTALATRGLLFIMLHMTQIFEFIFYVDQNTFYAKRGFYNESLWEKCVLGSYHCFQEKYFA